MVNPFAEVNWRPGVAEKRKFALSLAVGFPCLAALLLLAGWLSQGRWDAHAHRALALVLGGAGAGVVFWLAPFVAYPFYVAWYFAACCLGFVISNTLLAAVYFLLFTPVGLLKRLIKPALKKRFDRRAETYWEEARQPKDPAAYFKQF